MNPDLAATVASLQAAAEKRCVLLVSRHVPTVASLQAAAEKQIARVAILHVVPDELKLFTETELCALLQVDKHALYKLQIPKCELGGAQMIADSLGRKYRRSSLARYRLPDVVKKLEACTRDAEGRPLFHRAMRRKTVNS